MTADNTANKTANKSPKKNPISRAAGQVSGVTDKVRDWWDGARLWQRYLVYLLLVVFALIVPAPWIGSFMSPESDWTTILVHPIGTYILLALGLNVVVGYAGLLDLGYVAFFAIGGYTVAYFGTKYGWDFWATLV